MFKLPWIIWKRIFQYIPSDEMMGFIWESGEERVNDIILASGEEKLRDIIQGNIEDEENLKDIIQVNGEEKLRDIFRVIKKTNKLLDCSFIININELI